MSSPASCSTRSTVTCGRTGLQFGPDPAFGNRACVGGIVSNNATGSHSILYGMAADHVLEMQVILDDGTMPASSRLMRHSWPGRRSRRIAWARLRRPLPHWSATSAAEPPYVPARRATGGAAAAITWHALSTTAASTTICRRTHASIWQPGMWRRRHACRDYGTQAQAGAAPQPDRPGDHRVPDAARFAGGHAGDPEDTTIGSRADRRPEPAHGARESAV